MPRASEAKAQPSRRHGAIGLSFSGGGFRATAYALGTLTLLQDLGLLSQARVMSSVSGGSLALAAYLCAKAGSNARREANFRYDEAFFLPLMTFLEGERLAKAAVNVRALLTGRKLVIEAADATQAFLNELLNGGEGLGTEEAILGNEKITEMLANDHLSPDYVFINATNIVSLDLFRFGIERAEHENSDGEINRPIFVLNRYFLKHNRDSAEGRTLYHYAQRLRLADCVAASFGFPAGFEPLIFPDDFFRSRNSSIHDHDTEQAIHHFRNDLICDHKPYLAFLDGGLYDNLGLASVEDIRCVLHKRNAEGNSASQPVHYVIATDVDQIPTQYGLYTDAEVKRQIELHANPAWRTTHQLGACSLVLRLSIGFLVAAPVLALALVVGFCIMYLAVEQAKISPTPVQLLEGASQKLLRGFAWGGLVLSLLVVGFELYMRQKKWTPKQTLGLSTSFPNPSLGSWLFVAAQSLLSALKRPERLWHVISGRRLEQLIPAFNGYLKRTRSLTYGYLQQAYDALSSDEDCHLIRNMIFELSPGREIDPDYAANLITLPIQDYRSQEQLEPVSPIARKIDHARYVSALLQQLQADERGQAAGGEAFQLSVEELDLEGEGRWSRLSVEGLQGSQPQPAHWQPGMPLMPSLLTGGDGSLHPEAQRIINELNLKRADQLWRWLCNHLACFDDDGSSERDSGCPPAHPDEISITVSAIVIDLHQLFHRQAQENKELLQRCLVSTEESSTNYSWIPLLCEMATNVPTTLWLKDVRFYVPNHYDSQGRILKNGKWFVESPRPKDLKEFDLPVLDLSDLGAAPAAAICTVAGYVSTCFNLLDFFYAWLGNSSDIQKNLLALLHRDPFPFERRDDLLDLTRLPFPLRHRAWEQLSLEEKHNKLADSLKQRLPLLEYPLNRRNGVPSSAWMGREEE
jgi:hypothetical protein